jgi:pescadillo protein
MKPQITLDHLVKERYPRFIDALRDLDDALCMVHLFASMPSTGRITAERTANCAKLARHWQHYIAKSRTLQKVFVSVKGVYFQAEIMGEPVTWLVPHQFTQAVPKEIDVRVMLTFLEFYEVFLQFVLFKLYASQSLQYPPKIDQQLNAEGCFLMAMKSDKLEVQGTDASAEAPAAAAAPEVAAPTKGGKSATKASAASLSTLPKLLKELGNQEEEDDEEEEELGLLAAPLNDALQGTAAFGAAGSGALAVRAVHDEDEDETEQRVFATQDTEPLKRLFANLVFFVNREVPLEWMQLCTLAFGAKVAWDGPMSPFAVDDARITHQIVDRPQQGIQSLTREYVQPQWIFDCINAQMLLPTHNYRPGAKLPPHLSPFVDDDKEGYMPKYRAEIKKLQAQQSGAEVPAIEDKVVSEEESAGEEDEEVQHAKAVSGGAKGKAAEAKRKAAAAAGASSAQKKQKVAAPVSDEEESEEGSEDEEEEGSDSDAEEEEKQQLLKAYTGKNAAKKGPKGVVFQPEQESVGEVGSAPVHVCVCVCFAVAVVDLWEYGEEGNSFKRESRLMTAAQ